MATATATQNADATAAWNGRVKINCHVAGEAFSYDAGTVLDWPGGAAEAARYCVRGHAAPLDADDEPIPVTGEFADRLWAMSGLLRSNPKVLLKGRAKQEAETAALDAAPENAMRPGAAPRRPGRKPARPADDGPELSEDD